MISYIQWNEKFVNTFVNSVELIESVLFFLNTLTIAKYRNLNAA